MEQSLTIIGGTYFERCVDPDYYELWGSGLRAAAALSEKDVAITFKSCVGKKDVENTKSICATYDIDGQFLETQETVTFNYYHPLSPPEIDGLTNDSQYNVQDTVTDLILYYGMIEAKAGVKGNYVVYDPQNHVPFSTTGSDAKHLALILNKKEAMLFAGGPDGESLEIKGKRILENEKAEVVVIKNGSQGAILIEKNKTSLIPVYKTKSVWPIGSGDIFSAAFAWNWMILKLSPEQSATEASRYTAGYCQNRILPIEKHPDIGEAAASLTGGKKIYLAGPFFTMSERWLVNEFYHTLSEFGNSVFSPFHHVGLLKEELIIKKAKEIADKDLKALREADTLFCILDSIDAGTLFEIGYGKSMNKQIVIFTENIPESDLTMMYGTDCIIVRDFSTAVYMASW